MKMGKKVMVLLGIGLGLILFPSSGNADTAFISADVIGLSTNAVSVSDIELGPLTINQGYYLFPYYLRVEFPETNNTAWGIEMYTNNTSEGSWPSSNGQYGGLRGVTDPSYGIPVFWQAYNQLQDAAPDWGTPQSITVTSGGLGFNYTDLIYWGRLHDLKDANVVNSWKTAETLADRTIASYRGMGNFPASGRLAVSTPIYVYLGIDLSDVTMTQDYHTRLRLDLYNLGVNITQGGYATPNPFTPTTGQMANFNFFLENINSTFKINIFTIRGRKIRTITTSRQWDGRNDNGELVEGGLYLFQIEAEGRRVSGTVVLVK